MGLAASTTPERLPTWSIASVPIGVISRIASGIPARGGGIALLTHPLYNQNIGDWQKWRIVYESGDLFVEEYTKRMSRRESQVDFRHRKDLTPSPGFAKGAINEIKNAIFQRMVDVARVDGPDTYQQAVNGELGGIDLKGGTMNWFIGHSVIPELLVMRKVGVYIDMQDPGLTMSDKGTKHPYCYTYRAEDIRSWAFASADNATEFRAVLLRDYQYTLEPITGLPIGEVPRYRHLWIDPVDQYVHVQFYDFAGRLDGPQLTLGLRKIPFRVPEISESLMKDVANHQIALLNMESSDISNAVRANFPIYTEQYDPRSNSGLIKRGQQAWAERHQLPSNRLPVPQGQDEYCPPGSNQDPQDENIEVGNMQGRRYPLGTDRPEFIHPPAEPLRVSMEKQRELKNDIRTLVHLGLASVTGKSASADAKREDQRGLESGLSYIGLELQHLENWIAQTWADYEGSSKPATVSYPRLWSLKSVEETIKEVEENRKVRDDIPSMTFKKALNKKIARLMIATHVQPVTLSQIETEIDSARGFTSDPKVIRSDMEVGLLGNTTAAALRGYPDDEVEAAKLDHAERIARIAAAQTPGFGVEKQARKDSEAAAAAVDPTNPAARGLPDLASDPQAAALEKIGKAGRGGAQ